MVGFNTMYFKNKIYLFRYFKIKKGTLAKTTVDTIITQKEVEGIVRKRKAVTESSSVNKIIIRVAFP